MDLVVSFDEFTLQKWMHEAVQLQTPFSLSFPPWIKKAHLEVAGNRRPVQEPTNKHNMLHTAVMKMGLFDVSFNVSVIEENQKAKLQLWQYSFPLIQTK